ncbi:hypothetical protein, partial [Azotobacter salinestris]
HGQAPHLVLSFSRELSGIDLFHASLYREFDCRVNKHLHHLSTSALRESPDRTPDSLQQARYKESRTFG